MTRLSRVRAVPWLIVFEAARVASKHFTDVTSPSERRRLREILARTKGVPTALTDAEKRDLRRIGGKVDLKALGAELAPQLMRARSSRRRAG